MKTQKRQKLCLNCNGSVDIDVLICPFCGHDFLTEEKESLEESLYKPPSRTLSPNQTIASLYPPAYRPGEEVEQDSMGIYKPAQRLSEQTMHDPSKVQDPFQQTREEVPEEKEPSVFLPVFLFSLGAFLFSLGFFIFFFSTNGYAILKWNAKYWFVYFLMAIPLLIWGYRLLNRLDQPISEEEDFLDNQFEDEDELP